MQRLVTLAGELFLGGELEQCAAERSVDRLEPWRKSGRLATRQGNSNHQQVCDQIEWLLHTKLNIKGHIDSESGEADRDNARACGGSTRRVNRRSALAGSSRAHSRCLVPEPPRIRRA